METKQGLLYQFESCLEDFCGEEPTRTKVKEAWTDFLDSVKDSEEVPEDYYKLTKAEREKLYKLAGV